MTVRPVRPHKPLVTKPLSKIPLYVYKYVDDQAEPCAVLWVVKCLQCFLRDELDMDIVHIYHLIGDVKMGV